MGVPSGGGTCLDLTPGTPDPSCPSRDTMGFALAGRCSKAGVCGLDLSMGGLGCNALTGLSGLSPGGAVDAGSPQECGPGSGSGDAGLDGGADAAVHADEAVVRVRLHTHAECGALATDGRTSLFVEVTHASCETLGPIEIYRRRVQ